MKSKHTDEQLAWLRSHLPEYENRAAQAVRGDAKGFALKCAEEYITKWGLGSGPDEEKESQVKERIYTWFKNTSARGKEARRKHAQFKSERDAQVSPGVGAYQTIFDPSDDVKKPGVLPFPANPHASLKPIIPRDPPALATTNLPLPTSSPIPGRHHDSPVLSATTAVASQPLIDAFLSPNIPPASIAHLMAQSTLTNVYYSNLSSAIAALFTAASTLHSQLHGSGSPADGSDPVLELLKRYKAALPHLPLTVSHYGSVGPQAGLKALRVCLRKNATWISSPSYSNYNVTTPSVSYSGHLHSSSPPSSAANNNPVNGPPPPSPSALTPAATPRRGEAPYTIQDQMYRSALDRQRKKEHLVWAALHGAALELGLLSSPSQVLGTIPAQPLPTSDPTSPQQQPQIHTSITETTPVPPELDDGSAKLAEAVARDAIWEHEEVEWVAGAYLLRAVVRHARLSGVSNLYEWGRLLETYQDRWKDVKDEVRQQIMEDLLVDTKKALDPGTNSLTN